MTDIEELRTTEAHVYDGPGRELRREQLHLQGPQTEEVLLDVVACGVCHTDLHLLKEEIAFPHPAVARP
ncbi:alcohol dehydrogenase catalytic domain-containing protein [Nesterenkonia sp. F]|uniref:alcohol dehydrogenase catalytic domain-containing protein n=1 Tax=Nesterenkonia sp. F TaxID=795955 RepID=UPI0002F982D8|nr:alcohol dehydrogenase catalytic domain-containing protein [Nesterenkonia sp. F]